MASNSANLDNLFELAITHHQAGRLQEAEQLYRRILERRPNHPDALHYLGVIAYQAGRHATAVELISKAIKLNPSSADCYNNLGNALKEQGKLDEALPNYQRAIKYQPDYALAHNNLALLLHQQGKLDDAIASFQQALKYKSDYSAAHNNLGNTLKDQGRLDEAAASYRKALAFTPDFAMAHSNLGVVLKDQGRIDDAIASFRKALAIKPDDAKAHNNLGNTFMICGRYSEAAASYRQALSFKPDDADVHNNLGNALQEQGKLDDAVSSYGKALSCKPDFAEAYNNLGRALQGQGKLDNAASSYHKALSFKPDYADAYSNLLFLQAYHVLLDPPAYLALACGWEQACVSTSERHAARSRTFWRPPLVGRRLRLGYVSGDYRQHAVSYFIEQLFTHHDRARIELFAYSTHAQRDDVTARLESLVEHWVPVVGLSDSTMRERIEADCIDVLVDLSGHTAYNRLGVFARRAAPVQVYYLGYFASTGLTEMDYWIGDEILTPAEADFHFSERVWRLPRTCVSYSGNANAPLPDWHPAEDHTVWVGSFNHLNKLSPATLALWAKVLHALPEGRLLLKTKQLADAGNRQRILDAISAHGIAQHRVELQDGDVTPGWAAHMAYYDRLDIALDPVGAMGGVTTSCDALWMAAPVVTLVGDRVTSRMTASILDAIGHPEWIAQSESDYIEKVVALAHDVELRKNLRATQRGRMAQSPLCNGSKLAVNLENAYVEMFERWFATHPSAM